MFVMISFEIGPSAGTLQVHTKKEGVLSRMGHDLTLEVRQWSGRISVEGPDPENSRAHVEVSVQTDSIEVVGPPELSDKDRTEIQDHIAKDVLDAKRHAQIRFDADGLRPPADSSSGSIDVAGQLTLEGKSLPVTIVVRHEEADDQLRVRGETAFEQSSFGIRPFRAPLGVLKVADRVRVTFDLRLDTA